MKLKVNGEPARLFFRYSSSWLDKFGEPRQDVIEKAERRVLRMDGPSLKDALYGAVKDLPPNITECYIVKGDTLPKRGEESAVEKIAYGRAWRRPSEPHERAMARQMALASAIAGFTRAARLHFWDYYDHRLDVPPDDPIELAAWKSNEMDIILYDETEVLSRASRKKLEAAEAKRRKPAIVAPVPGGDIEEDQE